MQWYYAKDNQPVGPVEESDFQHLVRAGTISPSTLVWHEGMSSWEPCSKAVTGGTSVLTRSRPALKLASDTPTSCSRCGQTLAAGELLDDAGTLVCPACSGNSGPGMMEYAGFWIRFVAKFLDGIILGAIYGAIGFAAGLALFQGAVRGGGPNLRIIFLLQALQLVVGVMYSVLFVGKFGGTPGKLALKLRIVRPDGSPVSYGRAFGRFFAEFLSGILAIGYIMAGFDNEKRSLHDRICDTRVVKKP